MSHFLVERIGLHGRSLKLTVIVMYKDKAIDINSFDLTVKSRKKLES